MTPAEQPVLRNTGTCLPRQMCETPGEFLQVERHLEWVTRGHTVWGQTGVFLDREQGHGPNCEEVKLWKKEKGAGLSSCISTSPRKRGCDMDWTSNVAFYLGSPLLERAPGRSVGVWPTETWIPTNPAQGSVASTRTTGNAQENAGGQAVLQLSIHNTKTFPRGAFISFISSFHLTQAGIKLTAIHLPQVLELQA